MNTRLTTPTTTLQNWLEISDEEISKLKDLDGPQAEARRDHAIKTRGILAEEISLREKQAA